MTVFSARALHAAARRYCVDQIAHWSRVYGELRAGRPETFAYSYTDDDYRTFPRYNVLAAILSAIETWQLDPAAALDDTRARLVTAARTADNPSTSGSTHPLAAVAMAEERAAFEAFARASTPADWAAAAPLPERRVLATADADLRYAAFVRVWGTWSGGYTDRDALPPYLSLHTEVWDALPLLDAVRAALAARGVTHVVELRELGDCAELELAATDFRYNGAEGYWSVDDTWMIYASHEASVTFAGGWLVAALRAALPTLDAFVYRGWEDPPSARC